jgi:opacity protein-like surface antigen
MRTKLLLLATALILVGNAVPAMEWKDKTGVGIRGGLFAPTSPGDRFERFGRNEPFMMGLNGGLELRHGITENFVLDFTLDYISTYDDTTATDSRSFTFSNKDNSYAKLSGTLVGGAFRYYLNSGGKIQFFVLGGIGVDFWKMTVRGSNPAFGPAAQGAKYRFSDLSLKYGAGLNFWFSEGMTLDFQARMTHEVENLNISGHPIGYGRASRLNERPFTAYFQPTLGLTFYIGAGPDSDKDGVKNKHDDCPNTPPGASVDETGCPQDSDDDGVYDGIDNCDETPARAFVDMIGCPIDTDQDGVPDGIDRCANTPPGVGVDNAGCPADTDNDGVPDGFDECPDTPTGMPVDDGGCPIE